MATWNQDDWTPALAKRLTSLFRKHGFGHLRPVNQLAASAERNNGANILGVRAEHAYEAVRAESSLSGEEWESLRRSVGELVQEAQGHKPGREFSDWIQDAVIARAGELNLTAYALANQSGVSEDHVRGYLQRRRSMGSHKLQHVLRALGIELRVVQ